MSEIEKLLGRFAHREYREQYAQNYLNSYISHQLAVIRKQRGLSQAELAERIGTKQSGISRMEKDGYGRWNLATLQKVAQELGCRLKVSLETYESLAHEVGELSDGHLQRPAYEDDREMEFKGTDEEIVPGTVREMRQQVVPWLKQRGSLERLKDWLQGYDLPSLSDEVSPARWVLDGLIPGREWLWDEMARRVGEAFEKDWHMEPPASRPERRDTLVRNLLELAAGLRRPSILGECVRRAYVYRHRLAYHSNVDPGPEHPLIRAARYNQPDEFFWKVWLKYLEEPKAEYASSGLLGLSQVRQVNPVGVADGGCRADLWVERELASGEQAQEILRPGFSRVWAESSKPQLVSAKSWKLGLDKPYKWSPVVSGAWVRSLPQDLNRKLAAQEDDVAAYIKMQDRPERDAGQPLTE
jgi:transcriptional regulator with XRE-family HTH domain